MLDKCVERSLCKASFSHTKMQKAAKPHENLGKTLDPEQLLLGSNKVQHLQRPPCSKSPLQSSLYIAVVFTFTFFLKKAHCLTKPIHTIRDRRSWEAALVKMYNVDLKEG